MSQIQFFGGSSLPSTPNVEFIAGNDAVPVPPNSATHVINVVGNNTQGINVTGDAGTNTNTIAGINATTTQIGVVSLATSAQTVTGTVSTNATTPAGISAKLGTQTLNALAYGGGSTAALNWLPPSVSVGLTLVSQGSSLPPQYALPLRQITTPGAYPYTTLATDDLILVNTTAARTINLLASPATGEQVIIKDSTGDAGTNNITVVPNAGTIDGMANFVINSNYSAYYFVFNGTNWLIL